MGGSNRAFEPGNLQVSAPYFISGRTDALTTLAADAPIAELEQFGMADPRTPGAIVPTPIQISQIRMKYVPITVPTTEVVFEIYKGTFTTAQTPGRTNLAQKRKTTGYPAIATTETRLITSTTAALAGGDFAPSNPDAPFDVLFLGDALVSAAQSIWYPNDLCPLQLEAGEALQVRVGTEGTPFSGTGLFFIAFDFLR